MFDFQKLAVYQKAKAFHLECKNIMLNNNLDRYVNDQFGRAPFSVILNIAEGSGKFSKRDRRNFFVISRGSVFECVAILDNLFEQGIIEERELRKMILQADELSRMLFAMIQNLSRQSLVLIKPIIFPNEIEGLRPIVLDLIWVNQNWYLINICCFFSNQP